MVTLLHINEATDSADFLARLQRIDSTSYDFYYCCNICGGHLLWRVDSEDVGSYSTGTTPGSAIRQTSNTNSNIKYVSMILSVQNETTGDCIDSVLIATNTDSDWRPDVVCRGAHGQITVTYRNERYVSESRRADGAAISEVISLNTTCETQIIVCHSNDTVLSWSRNNRTITSFNESTIRGNFRFDVPPVRVGDEMYQALLLGVDSETLFSALFWTNFRSVESFNITCSSRMGSGPSLPINLPTTTAVSNEISTSNLDTTTEMITFSKSSVTAGGGIPLQHCKSLI